MKKKMLFMAAIAGLVTLGSCVKDDVSASVEAVRNAKANQLNAEAAYDNARAEHQRAISAAQVAHEQADAAAQAAVAKGTELANQVRAAALEAEIAKQIAQYEQQLANAKAQLQADLNTLATNERLAATQKQGDINAAITQYTNRLGEYTTAQKALIAAKIRLNKAQNDSEHAAEIRDQAIYAWQNDIKQQEALIEALKEIKSTDMSAQEKAALIAAKTAERNSLTAALSQSDLLDAVVVAGADLKAAVFAYEAAEQNYINVTTVDANVPGSGQMPGYYTVASTITLTPKAGGWKFADYQYVDLTDLTVGMDKLNRANLVLNTYQISEGAKLADEALLASWVKDSAEKAAYDADVKTLEDGIDKLGTDKDTKDTKTTRKANQDADGKQLPTLYAKIKIAEAEQADADTKAKAAKGTYDTAATALANAKKGLADAYKAAADDPTTLAKQKAIYDAKMTLAQALEGVFGVSTDLTPQKLSSYNNYNDEPYLNKWIAGSDGIAVVMTDFDDATATNYKKFDSVKEINEYIQNNIAASFEDLDGDGNYWDLDSDTDDVDADGIAVAATLSNHDWAKSTKKASEDAAATLKTKTAAVTAAEAAIAPQVTANANKTDDIYKTSSVPAQKGTKQKYEEKVAEKAAIEGLLAAVDDAAFKEAYDNLVAAVKAFNDACAAIGDEQVEINKLNVEIAALTAASTYDVDNAILTAEKTIADRKQSIANWESSGAVDTDGDGVDDYWPNDAESIIAQAQADVDKAEVDLAVAAANLKAAEDALVALVGEIDLDGDDEPAEGEGEGEAEGGEEAPAEGEGE